MKETFQYAKRMFSLFRGIEKYLASDRLTVVSNKNYKNLKTYSGKTVEVRNFNTQSFFSITMKGDSSEVIIRQSLVPRNLALSHKTS